MAGKNNRLSGLIARTPEPSVRANQYAPEIDVTEAPQQKSTPAPEHGNTGVIVHRNTDALSHDSTSAIVQKGTSARKGTGASNDPRFGKQGMIIRKTYLQQLKKLAIDRDVELWQILDQVLNAGLAASGESPKKDGRPLP